MEPVRQLVDEHNHIMMMVRVLEEACVRLERGEVVKPSDLGRMIRFFREFADGCHHNKEEQHLFPLMERAGVPRMHGPIGVMLAEHELGRKYLAGMDEALEQCRAGDTEGTGRFVQNARGYANLLSLHIERENTVLFPLAETVCTEDAMRELAGKFTEVERVEGDKHREMLGLLGKLKQEYLPPAEGQGEMPQQDTRYPGS